jgi:hypothetical protein
MKLLLAATFLIAINPAVSAEIKPEAQSFAAFWVQFKAAVAKEDKAAIVEMTKFPFDDGAKQLSKEEFIKKCGAIFGKKVQSCFAKAKPVKEKNSDAYDVFCGESMFGFEKVNGVFRFSFIGVND